MRSLFVFLFMILLSCSKPESSNEPTVIQPPVVTVVVDELLLLKTIEAGEVENLKTYLQDYTKINQYLDLRHAERETLLSHAYQYAPKETKEEILRVLLEAGADTKKDLTKGETLILRSFVKEDDKTVLLFLDFTAGYRFDERFLKIAFEKRNQALLDIVLSYDTDMNKSQVDRLLFTTLLEESHHEPLSLQFSRTLIDEFGADINSYDGSGQTPLIFLAKAGAYKAIEMLLEYPQLNLEQRDLNKQTALMHAVINGRTSTVDLLLNQCVDRWMKDSERKKACWYACEHGNKALRRELVKLLNTRKTEDERICGPGIISLRRCLCLNFL
ncbi:MAG: ankyrin repeat domain-containing protein [Bacteriovoracaceae bacterium]|nr:ankyrin repeat domain-containing protein [Bacteriovoracaceae bacterium]